MSRLTGADALGLYEAYQAVYNPQELTEEQVWEEVETWVNSLLEEGYDLSDYTWEEMYEEYLRDRILQGGQSFLQGKPRPTGVVTPEIRSAQERKDREREASKPKPETANLPLQAGTAGGLVSLNKPYPSQLGGKKGEVTYGPIGPGGRVERKFRELPKFADLRGGPLPPSGIERLQAELARSAAATPAIPKVKYPVAGTPLTKTNTPTATKTASTPPTKPTTTAATPAPRPTATAAAPKPAAAPAAKPAGSAMDQWAKANPKLAAAKAERDRTRGTSATTNLLMKDMKSRLPAPKTPSPTTSSTAFSKSSSKTSNTKTFFTRYY
jgi:hypothetical protein